VSDIILFDDEVARGFEPFALTRPAGELRAGALLVRERWERALGGSVTGYVTASHLRGFDEPGAAPVVFGDIFSGSWIVNARFAPALVAIDASARMLVADRELVGVRLSRGVSSEELIAGTVSLDSLAPGFDPEVATVGGWWMRAVWDYVAHLAPMLEHDIPILGASLASDSPREAIVFGRHPVYIEEGAEIEPSVCFDATAGPILVRRGAHVQAFTRLAGPLYVGTGSTLSGDRIALSSIGDVSKVHGELSNTIFLGHTNKGHDGFVGHSILGRWVNLGAGTITSNLKNTYGPVSLWTPTGVRDTGLQFLGTLFGDHAKTGIGTRLTTGTVIGAGANVYGSAMPPKTVAPFSWGEAGSFSDYRLDKFLDVAERMMARRHVALSSASRAQLQASYDARWSVTT